MGLATRRTMQKLLSSSSDSLACPDLDWGSKMYLVQSRLTRYVSLEQQEIPNEILQCTFSSVDCCRFSMPDDIDDDPSLMSRAPMFSDMSKLCKFIGKEYGIRAHKYGTASGLTNGTLSDIQQPVLELPAYRLKVKWNSPEEPFAVGGDSGSLIWPKDGETIIPLGLHCGSDGAISYSLSLQSICKTSQTCLRLIYCSVFQKSADWMRSVICHLLTPDTVPLGYIVLLWSDQSLASVSECL